MLFLSADSVFVLLTDTSHRGLVTFDFQLPRPSRCLYTVAGCYAYSFPTAFSRLTKYDTHMLHLHIYEPPGLVTPAKEC